ncbi:MAG: hypothetical protein J7J36_01605 [Thermoplasmata archaeon]|nr:hypothetical protein [Thermoplasmata archaeon]
MAGFKSMHPSNEIFALDKESIEIIKKTKELLDELIETIDILGDEKAMKKIEEAEKDEKEGRVRDFDEFLNEIDEL